MSDNIQHIDVDSDEFLNAPQALRDHVKKLQAANSRLSESNTDLSGRLTASALGTVLGEFKNPERVKSALLSDKVDPLDSEAVTSWLQANGDDYAKGAAAPNPVQTPDDAAEAEAHQRLQSGGELRQPASMSKLEAALAEAGPNATGDQLKAIYAKHGV
jgi:hypothetical protein